MPARERLPRPPRPRGNRVATSAKGSKRSKPAAPKGAAAAQTGSRTGTRVAVAKPPAPKGAAAPQTSSRPGARAAAAQPAPPKAATAHQLIKPAGWPAASGYAHGLSGRGRAVFLAGQVGWEPESEIFATDNFAAQVRQALANVATLLAAAGAAPRHLVRLTWYLTDRDAYLDARAAIGLAYRELLGSHYPPMSVVIVPALLESRAKVEIEATALVPD
jgi:enamine deaminase RidA (YjgF/YER057c/UK114 family)